MRVSASAIMSGALMMGAAPTVWADHNNGDGNDHGQGHDESHEHSSGATAPAPLPEAPSTGLAPNGRALGPATFTPILGDENYPVPAPPTNENLPPEVDQRAPFAQQISCDPQDRPGVTAFALLITEHYGRPFHSGARPCIDYASFHHDGRALDWALNAYDAHDRRIADSAIVWLTENDGEMAKRFGIEYLIWNSLIWHADGRGWHYYSAHPHDDHIHFSFTWDGAQMRTSWWTGVAVTAPDLGPCDVTPGNYAALHQLPRLDVCDPASVWAPSTGVGRVRPGESGGGMSMLQQMLGVPETGRLDSVTRTALLAWQEERGLPQTGVADDFTYAAALGYDLPDIPDSARAVTGEDWQRTEFTAYRRTTLTQGATGEAVEVLQAAIGAEVDGSFGPATAQALADFEQGVPMLALQAARRSPDSLAQVTPLTWLYLERVSHPTIALREVTLGYGALDRVADPEGLLASTAGSLAYAGGAVSQLQEMLGIDADGSFGPMTQDAVRAVQEAADLEPTGEVSGPTWVAIEQAALDEGRLTGSPGFEAGRARTAGQDEDGDTAESAVTEGETDDVNSDIGSDDGSEVDDERSDMRGQIDLAQRASLALGAAG